jgi:proline dehydrogenase
VDPTQIGHILDPKLARRNAFEIAERIAQAARDRPGTHLLMLDMEDSSVVDATLDLHDELRAAGLPVAITLQAYLRRTRDDLDRLIDSGATVRLVKGAFAAQKAIAFTSRTAIKAHSRVLIETMLGAQARASGFLPIVATHDAALQEHAARVAQQNGWDSSRWEIEMLLGVRDDLARAQARAGRRVRLYAPFGSDWWPYAVRRIGENPANARLLARSLLGGA